MNSYSLTKAGEFATSLGAIITTAALIWFYVWPRIKKWWGPYRDGIQSMMCLPVKLDEITTNQSNHYESTTTRINAVATEVATLASITRARADANPHEANFEANADGLLIAVNKTYTRWANREMKEVLNHGWKNTVHYLDRERVSDEWTEAVSQGRALTMRYRLIDGTLVEATATPIPEGVMPCERWVGVMRKVVDNEQAFNNG